MRAFFPGKEVKEGGKEGRKEHGMKLRWRRGSGKT
jgi:hypothetical protein